MSLDKIKVQKTAKKFVKYFDPKAKIEIEVSEAGDLKVNIETEVSGLLIGRQGETLNALQHLLRIVVARESEEFVPMMLDVSNYRASREMQIAAWAEELAQKVLTSGREEILPAMNAYERRIAHLSLKEIEGIETESVGEEPERRIVIRKK